MSSTDNILSAGRLLGNGDWRQKTLFLLFYGISRKIKEHNTLYSSVLCKLPYKLSMASSEREEENKFFASI